MFVIWKINYVEATHLVLWPAEFLQYAHQTRDLG
jgi:hypothetical protein